jgi:hypothetical protein
MYTTMRETDYETAQPCEKALGADMKMLSQHSSEGTRNFTSDFIGANTFDTCDLPHITLSAFEFKNSVSLFSPTAILFLALPRLIV